MPHQCLECGETFREGSVEILDGCPECEGTRFFHTDESLDADERQDLREQTQETVKEAIQEALEDPDDDVWSWERREEWLRLDPDEAREVLHDVVGDGDVPESASEAPTVKEAVRDLPEGAPDPDEGTTLSFPEAPDPDAVPDEPRSTEAAPEPGTGGEAPTPPPDDGGEAPTPSAADEGADPEPAPDPAESGEADRVTPAELANAARDEADHEGSPEVPDEAGPDLDPGPDEPEPDPGPGQPPLPDEAPEEETPPDPTPSPAEVVEDAASVPEGPPPGAEAGGDPNPDAVEDPNPDRSELHPPPAPEADEGEPEGRVGTVNVEEPGRYDIDVESLLDTSPVIIEKDGHYMVHLPSVFSSVDDEKGAR